MTSSTAEQEIGRGIGTEYPQLDAPDRASLNETLRAAIERARPHPVARRTLALIAQAALEPSPEPPGYRVVDRHGAPRTHPAAEGGEPRPLTLADLLDEVRARHPGLFLPPEPEPTPVPDEPRESTLAAGASEMRAATARFLESQSERARSLAERSSVQGRAFARSAAGALTSLQGRFRRAPAEADAAPDGDAALARTEDPAPVGRFAAVPGEEPRARLSERLGSRLGGLRDRLAGMGDAESRRNRLWLGGGAAAVVAMIVAAVLVNAPGEPQPTPAPASEDTAGAAPEARQAARGPAAPDNVTPPPEGDGRGDPDPDPAPAPPAPNAITGPAQVVDTATLKVGGKTVHLFGVEWVRGGRADELTRYIAGRPVTCQPAPGSESVNCTVDGRDLSEVVLYNGGGRASSEASPELVAAEDHARSERLGVWKR